MQSQDKNLCRFLKEKLFLQMSLANLNEKHDITAFIFTEEYVNQSINDQSMS